MIETKAEIIDTPQGLEAFCKEVADVVAVDTESDHFHSYNAQVCLIQAATLSRSVLIDPLAVDREGLAPFFDVLGDEKVVKLFHAGQNDLIELDRDYGAAVRNIFDTRIAARFLGYSKTSLSWVLEEFLGVKPGPNMQKFDWTVRPLPEKARRYAASDVVHLFQLRELLEQELEASMWSDAFQQTCAYIAGSARHEEKPFEPEDWRRVKGAEKLDGAGRAALKALYRWRHEYCTQVNQAAFLVVPNGDLLRLARQRPKSVEALMNARETRRLDPEGARGLFEALQEAKFGEIPPKKRPRNGNHRPPPPEVEERFKSLRQWRNEQARAYDLPGEYIATNATLSEIAAAPPASKSDLDRFEALMKWQRELFGKELLEVVSKS